MVSKMAIATRSRVVFVAREIAPNLMLGAISDRFFDKLERIQAENITLDFTGVTSVSRSFAHQYVSRRNKTRKHIKEVNMNANISRMLRLVERRIATGAVPNFTLRSSEPVTV
jgi:STAS-like domain of unknown function (DUF4325)